MKRLAKKETNAVGAMSTFNGRERNDFCTAWRPLPTGNSSFDSGAPILNDKARESKREDDYPRKTSKRSECEPDRQCSVGIGDLPSANGGDDPANRNLAVS